MVAISQIILSDVWMDYSMKFAKEQRHFVSNNEEQQNWIDAVNLTYGKQIMETRKELFSSIPSRFFITRLYEELSKKIN